jgi:histidinol dehydrogenase
MIPKRVLNETEKIIEEIKKGREERISYYTKKFDNVSKKVFRASRREIDKAYKEVSKEELKAMKKAAKNIRSFNQSLLRKLPVWKGEATIEPRYLPLDSAGCYVPGGRFPLPSSALMTVIPAKVAGVKKVVVCSPPPVKPQILVAADIAGADEIYGIGGIQAIAALAYGIITPKVDKIVGPGNIYVTAAKKLVYGDVDIDFLAGPSEIMVIADSKANSKFIAADLKAQAEHGPDSKAVLVTPSRELIKSVAMIVDSKNVEYVLARNMKDVITYANECAPEHLEFMADTKYLKDIRNAGAVFVGDYSPVASSDYASGSNHVLPTGGMAKSRGGLTVYDFLKLVSFQRMNKKGLRKLGGTITTLARLEGLEEHAKSIEVRL